MIGIIGAMECEVELLKNQLTDVTKETYIGQDFYLGKLYSTDVVIVKCGIGKVNAALCTQYLILHFNVSKIINTGIAGACGKDLKIFDFVVSQKVVYHDFDVTFFGYKKGQVPNLPLFFQADDNLQNKVLDAFNNSEFSKEHKIQEGIIASGDKFISEKSVKDEIIKDFSPLCVEMEGAAIAHTCFVNNIPFVIIRCMSDNAQESNEKEQSYEFNEEIAAKECAKLICMILK